MAFCRKVEKNKERGIIEGGGEGRKGGVGKGGHLNTLNHETFCQILKINTTLIIITNGSSIHIHTHTRKNTQKKKLYSKTMFMGKVCSNHL